MYVMYEAMTSMQVVYYDVMIVSNVVHPMSLLYECGRDLDHEICPISAQYNTSLAWSVKMTDQPSTWSVICI